MKLLPYTTFHYFRLTLVCTLLSLIMVSCKKEESAEIMDLKFPLDTYYVSEGGLISLYVNSGNQKYSVNVSDEDLIQVTVSATDWPAGSIYVKGLKKGSTELTVTDEVTGQEALLKIHVVDPFLALRASGLVPLIQGTNYETDQSIRNKIGNESQNFAEFEIGNVLILKRNADQQFYIFKSEEDVAKGTIYKSGKYTLTFSYGGPNRLMLDYDDSEEVAEYPIFVPNGTAFTQLLDFSRVDKSSDANRIQAQSNAAISSISEIKAEAPQNTSPVNNDPQLYLIRDFTAYFQAIHPDVERVELFQDMRFYLPYQQLQFGEGVLK